MAAFLTAHGYPCTHEIGVEYPGINDLGQIFEEGYVGISDPSITLLSNDQLKLYFKGFPCLLIKRSYEESRKSFEAWSGERIKSLDIFTAGLDRFKKDFFPMEVSYESLDDPMIMAEVILHLTGGRMDKKIWNLFNILKIEQHMKKAISHLNER